MTESWFLINPPDHSSRPVPMWEPLPETGHFTTLPVYPGQPPIWLEAHYNRLLNDGTALGLRFPWSSFAVFKAQVNDFCRRNVSQPRVVRIMHLPAAEGSDPDDDQAVSIVFSLRPFPDPLASLSITACRYDRPRPHQKQIGLMRPDPWLEQAREAGWDDYLRLSGAGRVSEMAYANVFFLRPDGVLVTPDVQGSACLPGITRQKILNAAEQLAIPAREIEITASDLPGFVGGFACNTVRGLIPIERIDPLVSFNPEVIRPVINRLKSTLRFQNRL